MKRSNRRISRFFRGVAAIAALLVGAALANPALASAFPIIPPIYIAPVKATVWAYSPTATEYRPSSGYTKNNYGGVHIRRTGVGAYTVTLENAGSPIGGVAHVVAYGSNPAFCTIAFSYPIINAETGRGNHVIGVRCFNATGAPADSRFVAAYTNTRSVSRGRLAYFTTDQAVPTGVRTIPSTMSYDSTGAPITYERIATGRYKVHFGPNTHTEPPMPADLLHVTAHGTTAVHCQSYPLTQEVWCSNTHGHPVDSRFSMTWGQVADLVGNNGGARFSVSYIGESAVTPGTVFGVSAGVIGSEILWNEVAGQILGTGSYQFTLGRMATSYGTAFVTTRTIDTNKRGYCVLASWYPSGSDEVVRINCYKYGGTPANLHVYLSFTTWPST